MSRRTLLPLARACSLQLLLETLVTRTNKRQGPHHPQVTTLTPLTVEPNELPAFIDAHDCRVGLIYGEGPSPAWDADEALLWIRFHPVPVHGCEQDGLYSGDIQVDVWQNEEYPLSPREVEWFIADYCGCTAHQWRRLPACWQKLRAACAEDSFDAAGKQGAAALALAGENSNTGFVAAPTAAPPPARRKRRSAGARRSGQPRSEAARWLQAEIAALKDIHAYDHLYSGWLAIYWQNTGNPPRNPYNSFKQTAERCVERILAARRAA